MRRWQTPTVRLTEWQVTEHDYNLVLEEIAQIIVDWLRQSSPVSTSSDIAARQNRDPKLETRLKNM